MNRAEAHFFKHLYAAALRWSSTAAFMKKRSFDHNTPIILEAAQKAASLYM